MGWTNPWHLRRAMGLTPGQCLNRTLLQTVSLSYWPPPLALGETHETQAWGQLGSRQITCAGQWTAVLSGHNLPNELSVLGIFNC